jgi:hypothetical protein
MPTARPFIAIGAAGLVMVLALAAFAYQFYIRPLARDDLPGRYSFDFDGKRQTIVIATDGTYSNTLSERDRVLWSYDDHWHWGEIGRRDGYGVTFDHFLFVVPSYASGTWSVVPERHLFGPRFIEFDPDLALAFTSE